ncbi:MAG: nucleotidyltransferase family protein [Candidatus Daviesbacteria bacterium]|nr:nucleotidyltransferase family protein [Candidatus Daviesbacteria bacterium]
MDKIKYAIILAGGKGERLRPYTNDRPKPMVEIAGKPILAYQLEQLKKVGVETVVFTLSYQREILQKHVGDGQKYGLKTLYSIEETPLGRGGAIKQAMNILPNGWQEVIIFNGDNLWKVNLANMIDQHYQNKALVTMVVSPLKSPYGIIEFDDKNHVTKFLEKPILPHWLNSGIYIFNKEIEPLLPDIGDHETETFPKLSKDRFFVFKSTEYWRGIDTVKDLIEAEKEVATVFN